MSAVWKKTSGVWNKITWNKVWEKTSGVWNVVYNNIFSLILNGVKQFTWNSNSGYITVAYNSDNISCTVPTGHGGFYYFQANVDFAPFTTLYVEYEATMGTTNGDYVNLVLGTSPTTSNLGAIYNNYANIPKKIIAMDVSSISGNAYPSFGINTMGSTPTILKIYNVWLV